MAVGKVRLSKPGDMTKLKRALKESGGGDKWFYRVPPDEEFVFRLMVEPYEFNQFKQHFIDGKSFPCTEGDCEGCDEGNDARPVWVAPVVDVEESRVRVLQMPKSIVESLMKKADRHGTVLDRDWILIREGSGKDNTKYELDSASPKRRDLSIYDEPDIEAMLEAQLEEAFGDTGGHVDDDDDDDPPPSRSRGRAPAAKKTAKRPARSTGGAERRVSRKRDVFEDVEDEIEDEPVRPTRRSGLKKKADPPLASKKAAREVAAKRGLRKGLRRN